MSEALAYCFNINARGYHDKSVAMAQVVQQDNKTNKCYFQMLDLSGAMPCALVNP